jgi:hypothetical protein
MGLGYITMVWNTVQCSGTNIGSNIGSGSPQRRAQTAAASNVNLTLQGQQQTAAGKHGNGFLARISTPSYGRLAWHTLWQQVSASSMPISVSMRVCCASNAQASMVNVTGQRAYHQFDLSDQSDSMSALSRELQSWQMYLVFCVIR